MSAARTAVCAVLALASFGAASETPEAYPTHSITLIVPFAPGGFTDIVSRVVADGLGKSLGQAIIVENRPGAGSTLGADIVAKSTPDGYRILMVSTTHVIGDALYKKLPYDSLKSFTPIAKIAEAPYVLVVSSKVKAKNVAELVAEAKASPGKLDYASSGNGSSQHLMAALFATNADIKVNHVPYKGSGQAATDLAGAMVDFGFMGTPVAIQQSQTGRLRAFAVTSRERSPQLPNVPTLDESGIKGYDASVWLGLLAPAGTPPAIIQKLSSEAAKVMNSPETRAALVQAGVEPSVLNSADFGHLLEAEKVKWAAVVKTTGATVD
ncbi:tripartite tricarboxylate transporter substrate binding protein [soil metagenome]